jgi:pre-mRNA-splicing factor SYF1
MLRIKRSVQAQYKYVAILPLPLYLALTTPSTDVSFIASQAVARGQQNGNGEHVNGDAPEGEDAMAAFERQARAPAGFVAASTGPQGGNIKSDAAAPAANPDAIDIDDDL